MAVAGTSANGRDAPEADEEREGRQAARPDAVVRSYHRRMVSLRCLQCGSAHFLKTPRRFRRPSYLWHPCQAQTFQEVDPVGFPPVDLEPPRPVGKCFWPG